MMKAFVFFAAVFACLLVASAHAAEPAACGMNVGDWCHPSPADPCDRYENVAACKADPACYGLPFKGESFAACERDERGFSDNCPTVGCTKTPPSKQ